MHLTRFVLTGLGALALGAGASTDARADIGGRLTKLLRLRREALTAKGPAAYVALRHVWQEWDRGEPAEVEDVLAEAASSLAVSPAVRAYAGLLQAYARRRRGDLDGAQSRVARLGFVGKWMVAGPFDNEGKAGFARAFGPEDDLSKPLELAKVYEGKERPVRWRPAPAVSPYGWFDLGVFMRPSENVCGYATTFVKHTRGGAQPISLWVGSAGALKVFWNAREVLRDEKYRGLDADRWSAPVVARVGWNRLTVKVCGDDTAPMLSLRLANAAGGPDDAIVTDPDPAHAADAPTGLESGRSTGLGGPMATFQRDVKRKEPTTLEAYARYLVLTSGDDPVEHEARDLASRAATLQPTVHRLLLAGDLAEDRNQRALWIERAEALVRSGAPQEDRLLVLRARAGHARSGPNPREALSYFERMLAIDPDDTPAVMGRADLYAEAGLRETAQHQIQQALTRRPRSVALLREASGYLRADERATESDELAERYAQLRFDDAGWIRSRIELAVAHGKSEAALRWVERLLAVSPDSSQALATAAKTYVALGERPRAVAAYKRALDLAPDDTDTMRALADVHAHSGNPSEQLALLRRVLELKPQDKSARDYVAHTEPAKARPDEAYARPAAEFLKLRGAPASGYDRRQLVDLKVTTVFPNGLASRFHQIVFQPLTDAAATEARQYSFGYQGDTEIVQLRGARVYRANGQIDEAIETGEGTVNNPSISMYSSARAYHVQFPRLNAGDVVELQYRIEDVAERNAFADYFGEVTFLQSSEPIARAEYVLITPRARTFYFNEPRVPGIQKTSEDRGDSRIHRFVAENVPPVVAEPLAPPFTEVLGHVHVSTYKSWDDMARWYWGLVRDQFIPDDEVKRRAAEITKGLTDDRAKVRAVYGYVVQKTRYVALEFGIHGFKPYRCSQIFARGFGDCKDKATLIVTMLKELGIPATIVILRTQQRGDFDTGVASLAPFDHAIAYVPSMDLYLDGTAENCGSSELPAMDRGALALQINEGKPKLVHLPDPPASESVTSRRIEAAIAPDGSAQLDWRAEQSGVGAAGWRRRYTTPTQRRSRVQEDLAQEFAGFEVTSVEAGDLENIEAKVALRVKGKVPSLARRDGDSWSVPAGPGEYLVRSFSTLSKRTRDLKLPAQTTNESEWVLTPPPGMRVVSTPTPSEASSVFGTYSVSVDVAGAVVTAKTTVAMTKTRIAAADYPAFRAWCEKVDRALGQRVVFSK